MAKRPIDRHKLGGAYLIFVDDWPRVRRWLNTNLDTQKEEGRWRLWRWTTRRQHYRLGYIDANLYARVVVIWDKLDAERFEKWAEDDTQTARRSGVSMDDDDFEDDPDDDFP